MNRIYGYARSLPTENHEQELNRQINKLKDAGAVGIITEQKYGDKKEKAALDMLLENASAGDTIICTEVLRIARSTQQLNKVINIVRKKELRLIILDAITIDCRNGTIDPISKAFLKMAGVFSELDLYVTSTRVKNGIANARANGRHIGRKRTTRDDIPPIFYCFLPMYTSGRLSISEFSRLTGLCRPTIYKYLGLLK